MFRELTTGSGKPQVSVLMPVYQQQDFVAQAVTSILGQTGIIAEIIISDDCSADGTFIQAERAVSAWLDRHSSPHRVLLRRGQSRLRRDHLPMLVDAAACDIVVQAHGDDLAHPMRCRVLHDVLSADPACALASSWFARFSETAGIAWETVSAPYPAARVPDAIIVEQSSEYLIGCSEAWKRSSLAPFGRLDSSFASVAHDRTRPFRASLSGYVAMIRRPLLLRRIHDQAWSRQMLADRGAAARFGWGVIKLNGLFSMRTDLNLALAKGLVAAARHADLSKMIRSEIASTSIALNAAFDTQTNLGLRIAWVSHGSSPAPEGDNQPPSCDP